MIERQPTARGRRPRPARAGTFMVLFAAVLCACTMPAGTASSSTETLMIRGRPQTLRTYGARGGDAVIVSSGDGGWIHLAPHIAQTLAAQGWFVVGFDVKSYLEGFTSARTPLRPEDVPGDYRLLVDFAAGASIHATHDEFISSAEAQQMLSHAADPKKLWIVSASDHRFSDNLAEFDARLLEAVTWVRAQVR